MKVVDYRRFYPIHEQTEEEGCIKGGNVNYKYKPWSQHSIHKQMFMLWCPWNILSTHVMFHSFKVLAVKHNK
jgi:hypothetical protein